MRWVGFVRNVMIGRAGLHREVLLDACTRAGGADPVSYIATGNLAFTADDIELVLPQLEAAISNVVQRPTPVMVRDLDGLSELVRHDPLASYRGSWAVELAFLRHDAEPITDLPHEVRGTRVVQVGPREVGFARPRDDARAPHANPLLERLSGQPASSRAWSTLVRIAEREQARR